MKLSYRCEYALLALLHLARQDSPNFISAKEISAEQGVPIKFLEQILLQLKLAKYLKSGKGRNGGFKLARPAGEITVAEVVRLIDGALAPSESVSEYFYDTTPIAKEAALVSFFRDIRDYTAKKMETTSIQDLA